MSINPLTPPLPSPKDNQLNWKDITPAAASLSIVSLAKTLKKPIILFAPDTQSAEKTLHEIRFFSGGEIPVHFFPDWETLPYDHFSPHSDLTSDRLLNLYKMPTLSKGIIITTITTAMHRLAPCHFIQQNSFVWQLGDTLDIEQLRETLTKQGYRAVEQVFSHGEFAVRGAIIDVFPMGSDCPYRLELFDDEIDSLRSFDPETQRSLDKIQAIELLPAHEYPLTDVAITHFRQNWRELFPGNPMESPVYQQISKGLPIGGIEYYLPLFFEQTHTLFDYLPQSAQLVFLGNLPDKAQLFWHELNYRYEQLRYDNTRPLCEPHRVFLPVNSLFEQAKAFNQIHITTSENESLPDVSIDHRKRNPLDHFASFLLNTDQRILICAESSGRREVLADLFQKAKINFQVTDNWQTFLNAHDKLAITIAPLDRPLTLSSPNVIVLTETQLFGQHVSQRRRQKKRAQDPNALIKSLAELEVGALVVHIDHGIGRYQGLEKIALDGIESEFLTLTYEGGDKIYVPINSLDLISRYTGADSDRVALNKLGTAQWKKSLDKAAKQIRDTAAELLKIYSERQATPGFQFKAPTEEFFRFKAAFPFEETLDQTQTIASVIQDMTSDQSMDRLICGDVGFGKTEVAMQAAFLAVENHKQVAVLVPTTLLANQHFQNFQDRFSDWPIKIAVLSRLQTPKEQKETLEELAQGKIDIIVSTHKILGDKIKFKNLGLLIVDEEHRFGVRQKDRIKELRAHVDILTLTATPIPRTLNQSMNGIRDLSIIATPPAKRLSIKTFVNEFNPTLIREAILRETMRGGQVYFLHNDVAHMPGMVEKLQEIVPEVSITYAHGQMPERQLEQTMSAFYHQRHQVLVASTIIESGIDIPSANTIIINNANHFGLAQLHQMRGRVGRSHHQAYAYLLVKNRKGLTKDAKKRLEAISELEDLGVGFQLATHDLEIRGAGELLGESQSGHMHAIGFSLYMELLDEAVKALQKGEAIPTEVTRAMGPDINLTISALFPESFMPDVHTRLTLYKRLSICETASDIQELKSEIIDRFGLLPEATQNLFAIAHLKLRAKALGIEKIDVRRNQGAMRFNDKPNIDPKLIIDLIQKQHKTYQLSGANVLKFKLPNDKPADRISAVEAVVALFENKN